MFVSSESLMDIPQLGCSSSLLALAGDKTAEYCRFDLGVTAPGLAWLLDCWSFLLVAGDAHELCLLDWAEFAGCVA